MYWIVPALITSLKAFSFFLPLHPNLILSLPLKPQQKQTLIQETSLAREAPSVS